MVRAWRNRAACRQPQNPWPWLKQILHNEAMRHLAQRAAQGHESLEFDVSEEDAGLDDVLERLSFASTTRALPRAERDLLRMHYEQDLSVAALARLLDVPEGAVKVRLHRARNRLRAELTSTSA